MNKITILLTAILLTGLGLSAQQTDLSAVSFAKAIKKAGARIQLIDVRTPGEFNGGHLALAQNIDFNDRKFAQEIKELDPTKPIYIYCLSGGRSKQAMELMANQGFKNIINLKGGIMAWRKNKFPVAGDMSAKAGLSLKEFNKLVDQNIPVLVDFNATWCGPCRLLKPSVKRLAGAYPDKIKVIYIDIDKNRELANQLRINSIPLLHYYKKGNLKRSRTGLISYQELERLIR